MCRHINEGIPSTEHVQMLHWARADIVLRWNRLTCMTDNTEDTHANWHGLYPSPRHGVWIISTHGNIIHNPDHKASQSICQRKTVFSFDDMESFCIFTWNIKWTIQLRTTTLLHCGWTITLSHVIQRVFVSCVTRGIIHGRTHAVHMYLCSAHVPM